MIQTKSLDLFAGIPVADYAAALTWYERLLGSPPTFVASDTEAVWDLAEHRSVYIVQRPEHAGHTMLSMFVDDPDAIGDLRADRGLDPLKRETYADGVRKTTYRDPDGNEIGFGGVPQPPQPIRSLKQLDVLVGQWTMVGSHPQLPSAVHGQSSFEWLREGALLAWHFDWERGQGIPSAFSVIGHDDTVEPCSVLCARPSTRGAPLFRC